MAETGRGWVFALGSLAALLLAATTAAVLFATSLAGRLIGGVSFTGEDDPAYLEWLRLQTFQQVLASIGPPIGTTAGLAIVALLFVLARRWDARVAARG